MLEYVYDQYIANNIPIEAIWSDIDYMSDYKIFTISDAYSRLPALIKRIKDAGGRYVPILDPGVAKRPG
jgi:alpha-glucosidase (family GH31 glycosyl hydrolase)